MGRKVGEQVAHKGEFLEALPLSPWRVGDQFAITDIPLKGV
jgi:hypothetical protein